MSCGAAFELQRTGPVSRRDDFQPSPENEISERDVLIVMGEQDDLRHIDALLANGLLTKRSARDTEIRG